MKNYDLSILIPARNEMFLSATVENILKNIRGNTEVIVALDGAWADPGVPDAENVTVVYFKDPLGQRAATNQLARLSTAKYLMKLDAHCVIEEGMDVKMIEAMKGHDNWTMVPVMYNLHGFDWLCPDGHRIYQGPTPAKCLQCGKPMVRDVKFEPRKSRKSTYYRFDKTLHFKYYGSFGEREEAKIGVITGYNLSFDTMSVPIGVINLLTDLARSHQLTSCRNLFGSGKDMTMNTMGLSSVDDGRGVGSAEVDSIRNQFQMERITAFSVFAKMVNDENIPSSAGRDGTDKPSIKDTMGEAFFTENSTSSITCGINSSNPIPTPGCTIRSDIIDKFSNILGGKFVYSEKTNSFHNGSVTLTLIRNKDLAPSLSIQGSCFMLTRERWWALDICDERHGSWGQQGVEVACKTWLSGGEVMINKKTWYSHMFRTQGGDFGFPFPLAGADIDKARKYSRELFIENKWDNPNKIHDFQWLLDKFKPVPDWHMPEDRGGKPSKGIVYYTHGVGDPVLLDKCRRQIKHGMKEKHIVSVSLTPLKFGKNVVVNEKPGYLTMAKQIYTGLLNSTADVIFFCEHDVLYHPSHFNFLPLRRDVIYYNTNVWRVRYEDGHALFCNDLRQLSGLVAYRDVLIKHYEKRVVMLEAAWMKDPDLKRFGSFVRQMGFEPGTHGRQERVDDLSSDSYQSQFPNLDIRTATTLTPSRWRKDQFVNQRFTEGWTEADEVTGWGVTKNRVPEIIASIK